MEIFVRDAVQGVWEYIDERIRHSRRFLSRISKTVMWFGKIRLSQVIKSAGVKPSLSFKPKMSVKKI